MPLAAGKAVTLVSNAVKPPSNRNNITRNGVDHLVVGELSAVGGLIGDNSASRVAMPTRDVVIGRGNTCATCAEPEVDGVPLVLRILICRLIRAAKRVEAELKLRAGAWCLDFSPKLSFGNELLANTPDHPHQSLFDAAAPRLTVVSSRMGEVPIVTGRPLSVCTPPDKSR